MMKNKIIYIIVVSIIIFSFGIFITQTLIAQKKQIAKIELTSPVVSNNQYIPDLYTCEGKDISPPLSWDSVPEGTKSFVLTVDDPDAPFKTWVHWVIYNIPDYVRELPMGISSSKDLHKQTKQGINDFKYIGYGGPCPPAGPAHRYFFKLYALDTQLNIEEAATKEEVLEAIQGHILGKGELVGLYKR